MSARSPRVWTVSLLCVLATQASSGENIRIRVLNGRNGKPVVREKVSLYVKGEKNAGDYVTGTDGTFTVDLDRTAELLPSTEWWITCRAASPSAPHLFSVEEIHDVGAADQNTCGKAKGEVIRGTLTIFARKASSFENLAR